MANIDTSPLPDGAQCYVTSLRRLFRFRKHSTATAVADLVIVPIAGGGRWIAETGVPSGALPFFAAATNTNTSPTQSTTDWVGTISSNYAMQLGTGAWTFSAGSCSGVYHGPPATYLCRLVTTLTFSTPDTAQIVVDHNSDMTGTAAGFAEGAQFVDAALADSTESYVLVAERIVTLATGDSIDPRFRLGGENDLDIERLTLSAIPIG